MERAVWVAIAGALAASGCNDACDFEESYCDGNVAHTCTPARGGDYWHIEDCEEKSCVDTADGSVLCALETEPRAACTPQVDDYTCDGSERVMCSKGFVLAIEDCPSGCELEITQCVARAGVDPTCEQLPTPVGGIAAGYCEGETALHCVLDWVTSVTDCASNGMQCYELDPGVYPVCVASDTPDSRCGQQRGIHSVCVGNIAVNCANDRLIRETNCTGVCESGFCR